MDKKGQFFLIATVIIVGLIVTLSTIYISTKTTKEDTTIYDLSKEINFESNSVIDRGVAQSEDISNYLENLTSYYAAVSPGTDILVVSGNENEMSARFYGQNPSGFFGVGSGGGSAGQEVFVQTASTLATEFVEGKTKIRVYLNQTANEFTDFELMPGENFYLILQKSKGEEKLVARE